jgi:hypothetical protein
LTASGFVLGAAPLRSESKLAKVMAPRPVALDWRKWRRVCN